MSESENVPLPRLLKSRGIRPSRRLGQNFMVDRNMLDFLVRQAVVDRSGIVLEVGAGVGFLTQRLLAAAAQVVAVEIDSRLCEITAERLADAENLVLLNCDALDRAGWHGYVTEAINRFRAARPESPLQLVSNLPYSAATAVVQAVLLGQFAFSRCIFTVQWEVAERLAAEPGHRRYGYISALAALLGDIRILRKLPPTVFWPRPKIDSAVVELVPSAERKGVLRDLERLSKGLSMLFGSRRKQLLGSLKRLHFDESVILRVRSLLARRGISGNERIFNLPPEVLSEISSIITG